MSAIHNSSEIQIQFHIFCKPKVFQLLWSFCKSLIRTARLHLCPPCRGFQYPKKNLSLHHIVFIPWFGWSISSVWWRCFGLLPLSFFVKLVTHTSSRVSTNDLDWKEIHKRKEERKRKGKEGEISWGTLKNRLLKQGYLGSSINSNI